MRDKVIHSPEEVESRIGYTFKDKSLLRQAVTHSSFANEQKINRLGDYERLEFLGDAVLEMTSSDFLFHTYPGKREGQLTRMRAAMVCEPALAVCARDIGLDSYILLGRGEESTGGRSRDSIVSDVLEAVIGAIYLDGGIDPARAFVLEKILKDQENRILFYDSKTVLQEMVQADGNKELGYELLSEEGPDHAKVFRVQAMIGGQPISIGEGRTKKAAEQQAAYEAILMLKKAGKKE